MLDADPRALDGIMLSSAVATTMTLAVSRDGVALGKKTMTPLYQAVPGPNGHGCEPKECRFARAAYP